MALPSQSGVALAEKHEGMCTDLQGESNEDAQGPATNTDIKIGRQAQVLVPISDNSWGAPRGSLPQGLHSD